MHCIETIISLYINLKINFVQLYDTHYSNHGFLIQLLVTLFPSFSFFTKKRKNSKFRAKALDSMT